MNSYGDKWCDGGFFKIKDENVFKLEFFDIFWTLDDLKPEEKKLYE
jgi:hypothetical protein